MIVLLQMVLENKFVMTMRWTNYFVFSVTFLLIAALSKHNQNNYSHE